MTHASHSARSYRYVVTFVYRWFSVSRDAPSRISPGAPSIWRWWFVCSFVGRRAWPFGRTTMKPSSRLQRTAFRVVLVCCQIAFLAAIIEASSNVNSKSDEAQRRLLAKPWYARHVKIGSVTLPFSPASIMVFWIALYYLISSWNVKEYAVASHILMDSSDKSKTTLEALKIKIGRSPSAFAKAAQEKSTCPSKDNGGKLGRFPRGAMTPPFDKVCFDRATPLETAVGPVQTQFGWHLIYLHERKM